MKATPTLSIGIIARNEEKMIRNCIKAAFEAKPINLEALFVGGKPAVARAEHTEKITPLHAHHRSGGGVERVH